MKAVEKAGKQYLFFTNNSSRSPRDYMAKLEKMGCPITRDQIMTSGEDVYKRQGSGSADSDEDSGSDPMLKQAVEVVILSLIHI